MSKPPVAPAKGQPGWFDNLVKNTRRPRLVDDPMDIGGDLDARMSKDTPRDMAKGGKITRVAGPKRGEEDGLIAVQKGEFVVRKAAVQKHGDRKMAAVNNGTAKITVPKRSKR